MKFTPEEMAYEPPKDVSDPKRYPTIARGREEWERFLSFKRGFVRLAPDLREFFKDDTQVNDLLRQVKAIIESKTSAGEHGRTPARRRKTA